jgi:uncharacterized Zn-finger protein
MASSFSPTEILYVNSKKVSCDGSKDDKKTSTSAVAGHPMIYLNMGSNDFVVCPYCSKYFTIQKSKAPTISKKITGKND